MSDSIFLTDGNGTITGLVEGRNYSGELTIPEYIDSERIINIGEEAFFGYQQLTSVVLPNSVINIMANAFCSCTDLKSITTPSNLITIGAGAFVSCWELTSIVIPDSINTIGHGAFVDCPKLTVIYVSNPNNIPDAVSSYDWSGTGSSVTFAKYVNRDIDYIIKSGALIDIADKIRVLSGTEETMTPAEMVDELGVVAEKMDSALFLVAKEGVNVTIPDAAYWYDIAYGNGKFVAVGGGYPRVAYSEDGINWEITKTSTNGGWIKIVYGNGKFVTISGSSYLIACSEDGINWTETSMSTSGGTFDSIAYGNGKFVAIKNNCIAAYSEDGINWTENQLPYSTSPFDNDITYGNGKFVTVGYGGSAAYSEDGINWTKSIIPNANWCAIAYGNGKFVALASNSDKVAYSEDGINWAETSTNSSGYNSILYGNGKFIAVFDNVKDYKANSKAEYSEDGINWTKTSMPSVERWCVITYADSKFMAVSETTQTAGRSYNIFYSIDGINWSDKFIYSPIIESNIGVDVTEETIQATGIFDEELATQDSLIAQLSTVLDSKASGGSGGSALETCSVRLADGVGSGGTVYYCSPNGASIVGFGMDGVSITVVKDTPMYYEYSYGAYFIDTTDTFTLLTDPGVTKGVFKFSGDGSVTFVY